MSTDTNFQITASATTAVAQTVTPGANQQLVSGDIQAATSMQMPATTISLTGNKLPQEGGLYSSDTSGEAWEINEDDVSQAIQNLNDYAQNISRQLQFSVDDVTGRTVIKVLDTETKETIRQIPSEEILNLARSLHESDNDRGKLLEIRV